MTTDYESVQILIRNAGDKGVTIEDIYRLTQTTTTEEKYKIRTYLGSMSRTSKAVKVDHRWYADDLLNPRIFKTPKTIVTAEKLPPETPAAVANWSGVAGEVYVDPETFSGIVRLEFTRDPAVRYFDPIPLASFVKVWIGCGDAPEWGARMVVYRGVLSVRIHHRDDKAIHVVTRDMGGKAFDLAVASIGKVAAPGI